MEFEFDKEMDSLLRQAARADGEVLSKSFDAHVDADEISLFAENALPIKARMRVTEHLADCRRCRKILSGVIALNTETESEIVHAGEIKTVVAANGSGAVPWYKKLFMFPQLAYAMGALALVFSGIIALMVLQNARESQNSAVAMNETTQERSQGPSDASVNEFPTPGENYAMSNSSTANANMAASSGNTTGSVISSNTTTATTSKPLAPASSASNSNAAARLDESLTLAAADKELKAESETVVPPPTKPAESVAKEDSSAVAGAAPKKRENNFQDDGEQIRIVPRQQNELSSQNSVAQNQSQIMPDSQNVRRSASTAARTESRKSVAASTADTAEAKNKSAETRTAAGKVFRRADGVWYDPNYKGQQTTNVRRGSDEYKKLDAGLRSIAETIDGTVVIIWKQKAYRIQ